MKLNEISGNYGAHHRKMRLGRGIGSTKGKTAGRGYKGQKSRTGVRLSNFAGGQKPIFMVIPKKGFNNKIFKKQYTIITLTDIQNLSDCKRIKDTVSLKEFISLGLLKSNANPMKILANGELKVAVNVEVSAITAQAKAKIEKAGGKVTVIEVVKPVSKKVAKKK